MCEAVESPQYTGPAETRADLAHDGQLPWVVGASSYQVVRSVPSNPSATDGSNASFRHHHFLAWWGGRFWVYHIAAAPNDESSKHGRLNWSADGMTWANADSAPIYPIATHQRAAFYVAANNVFLVTTWYSHHGEKKGRGGAGSRLVRRINGPGDFGPLHVLKHNHKGAATIPGGPPPLYTASSDAAFKTACAELLDNKLYRQQLQEEDQDPAFYVVNGMGESPMARAFNWYTRNKGEIVGLWKYADTVATAWDFGQVPAPQDYTSRLKLCTNSKIWGCKTTDGRFALFGNPYFLRNDTGTWEYQVRYPLAVSASADGVTFDTPYATVEGDMDPMRYPDASYELFGDTKAVGPQYVRGIEEGFPKPDNDVWLVTSHNKEDLWVTRVPVPIVTRVTGPVNDGFQSVPPGGAVPRWNIRSEQWATVKVAQEGDNRFLRLTDKAEVGYAKAFRVFEAVTASGGNNFGWSDTGNALGAAGAAGGIFARSQAYGTFADTTIGTLSRAGSTLRMTGSFCLANDAFDGHFYLGFFNPASLSFGQAPANFVGIQITEPAASAGDPFRGSALVAGTGGNGSATINLTQNTTLAFDLTWTGGADGSGTLSGTLAGYSVNVTVGAGAGNFTAFGLLCGGMTSGNPAQKTAGCHFDNLGYTTSGGVASETFDTAASTAANGWTGFANGAAGAVADLSFRLRPQQANHGRLAVDVMDRKGQRPVRLAFDATGAVRANSGETMSQVASYTAAQWLDVAIRVDMNTGTYSLRLGGTQVGGNRTLAASNGSVERLEFRTGTYRLNDFTRRKFYLPTDTMSGADTMVTEAVFDVDDVAISDMKHVVVPFPKPARKSSMITPDYLFNPDPTMHVINDRLYLFTSHDQSTEQFVRGEAVDPGNPWATMFDYHAMSTTDLKTWVDHGSILSIHDVPWTKGNAVWDGDAGIEANGKFYAYVPCGYEIGVFVSDHPAGPYVDVLGRPLISKEGMLTATGEPLTGFMVSPSVFYHDGSPYLIFGQKTAIYAVKLKPTMTELEGGILQIPRPHDFVESPMIIKIGERYYLTYSNGGMWGEMEFPPPRLMVCIADNPFGPYSEPAVLQDLQINPEGQGYRHRYASSAHQGFACYRGQWYFAYHRDSKNGSHRHVCVTRLDVHPDGTLGVIDPNNDPGVAAGPIDFILDAFAPYKREAEEFHARHQAQEEVGIRQDYHFKMLDGGWLRYNRMDFGAGAGGCRISVSCEQNDIEGAVVEFRLGAVDGMLIGSLLVRPTGGKTDYALLTATVTKVPGIHDLFIVARNTGADRPGPLFNINWFTFTR